MPLTIDVYNANAYENIFIGDVKILPGTTTSFDRKKVVIGRYAPWNTYEASLYRDLLQLIASTTASATITYDSITLTAATLAELDDVDVDYDGEILEHAISFDDGGAGNAVTTYWTTPSKVRVTGISFTAGAAITAHDTNFATFQVTDRTAAPDNPLLATASDANTTKITGGTGDIAQWATYDFTLTTTTGDLDIASGSALDFQLTKAGGGVAVAGTLKIKYKRLIG